jgi:hypothetical protein
MGSVCIQGARDARGLRGRVSPKAAARWCRVAAALLWLAAIAGAQAQGVESQAGNLHFRIPDGWVRVDQAETAWLIPKDLPPGRSAVLMIYPSQPLSDDLPAWATSFWTEMEKKTWKVESKSQPAVSRTAIGTEFVSSEAWLVDQKNPTSRFYTWIVGLRNGPRVESFQFITNAEELRAHHQTGLLQFVSSVSFVTAAPPAHPAIPPENLVTPSFTWGKIEPPRGQAGLNGMYVVLLAKEYFDPGTYRMTVRPQYSYWVFFPDGHFYAALPEEGLENFKYDYWHMKNPVWCGTYRLSGDRGELVYDDDGHTTVSLRRIRSTSRSGPQPVDCFCPASACGCCRTGWRLASATLSR